jgi:hypothetical protein
MSPTPTAAPPTWLEAAAKLDALIGDKVPLSAARTEPAEEVDEETAAAPEPDAPARETGSLAGASGSGRLTPEVLSLAGASGSGRLTKPRITPPLVVPSAALSSEEVELAWHGYSAAALVPSTIALAALSAGVILALRPLVPTWVLHEAADAPLAALWLLQAIRAGYRLFGYNYRLTTRRLFRERGRLYPPDAPVELATVVRAEVRQSLIGRLAGVGTIRVIPEEVTPNRPAVDLIGVRRPQVLAARIEEAASAAREANVTVGRMPSEPEALATVARNRLLSEPESSATVAGNRR